jgi:hypothetical protein
VAAVIGLAIRRQEPAAALAAANVLAGAGGGKCACSVDVIGFRVLEAINQP